MSVTSVLVPSDAFFTSGFQQQSWSYETVSPTRATAAFAQLSSSSSSSVSLTSSSLPAPTSTPPVPPAPAATFPSSSAQTSFPKSSVGNYAASASAAASNISSPMYINQPPILAGIVVGCISILTAIAAAAFFLSRRSRRRINNSAGMTRITSRDDMQGTEKRPWKADAERAGSPTESTVDLRPPPWAERSPVPSTLPSYSSRISRPSRHSSTVRRSSATWEDNSEIDVLATDGSSTIRTFSTYSEPTPTATTPTLTTSGSPLTATVGSLSPSTTMNPFDHPGYTYPAGSSNAAGSRHRPQLSIDTSGVVFEPRTRSRAEHLRDEYMRSQVALNPFDDSAAPGAEQPELYRSPAWSHGNRPSRTMTDAASPWVESGAVIGADGSAESERRGRSRMVMPPTYNKLFPSSAPQPIQ